MSIKLTEGAVKEIKRVMQEQDMNIEEFSLMVSVEGGGCSGFNYKLGFEKRNDIDESTSIIENQFGIQTTVDERSDSYLDGTIIDWYSGLEKRGFTFSNPNSVRSCGCGSSFSVSENSENSGGCGSQSDGSCGQSFSC